MILDRVFTAGLAQVAYLIADEKTGEAAVIDPRRDIDVYLTWAAERGLRIVAGLETHVHADFVSGSRELAAETGARIYTSRLGNQAFPHDSLDDGDEVRIGSLILRAFWTPGHTPEHLSYLLFDPEQGESAVAIFSGDALFVGEVGRPDLLGAERTQRLASQLYETVSRRLSALDDDVVVYPGHTAGSACGKQIGEAPFTTIGRERRFNYAFQARSEAEFIQTVLADMPAPPTYYPVLKRVNKAGAPLLNELSNGAPLAPAAVADRLEAGALVIDARTSAAFGASHVPGALSAELGPSFSSWIGWLAPYDRELIIVLDERQSFDEAQLELRRIGLDRVAGFLDGGMAAWQAEGREVAALAQLSVRQLADRIVAETNNLTVLDVRSREEWLSGHIPSARHRFIGEIARGAATPINGEGTTAIICGAGHRSSLAASLLAAQGHARLVNVIGGMEAWATADLPVTKVIAAGQRSDAMNAAGMPEKSIEPAQTRPDVIRS